jgi:hypothetical protein
MLLNIAAKKREEYRETKKVLSLFFRLANLAIYKAKGQLPALL